MSTLDTGIEILRNDLRSIERLIATEEALMERGVANTIRYNVLRNKRDALKEVLIVLVQKGEYIVTLSQAQRMELIEFLGAPNGSHRTGENGRLCVEAVEGGKVWFRSRPYSPKR